MLRGIWLSHVQAALLADRHRLLIEVLPPAPEPTTMVSLGIGLALIAIGRKKRQLASGLQTR